MKTTLKSRKNKSSDRIIHDIVVGKNKRKNRNQSRKKQAHTSSGVKLFFAFIILGVLISLVVFWIILPKAEILIFPVTSELTQEMKVFIDQSINQPVLSSNSIPGGVIKLEKEFLERFPATGESIEGSLAKGIILIFNEDKALTLIPSRFESASGKVFATKTKIRLNGPAQSSAGELLPGITEAEVEAEAAGADYNLEPTTFVLPAFREIKSPRYAKIYAKSEQKFTGGANQGISFVSSLDIAKALTELKQRALTELISAVPVGMNLIEGTVKETGSSFQTSVGEGERASAFNAKLSARLEALAFDKSQLEEIAKINLLKKTLLNWEAFKKSLTIDFGRGLELSDKRISLTIKASQIVYRKIEVARLSKFVAGLNEKEAVDALSQELDIKSAEIRLWPFWARKIPNNLNRILIKVAG